MTDLQMLNLTWPM